MSINYYPQIDFFDFLGDYLIMKTRMYAVFVFLLFALSFSASSNKMAITQTDMQTDNTILQILPDIDSNNKESYTDNPTVYLNNVTFNNDFILQNSETAIVNNSHIDELYLSQNSSIWLINSFVEYLEAEDGSHVKMLNTTVLEFDAEGDISLDIAESNISESFIETYNTVSIVNSHIEFFGINFIQNAIVRNSTINTFMYEAYEDLTVNIEFIDSQINIFKAVSFEYGNLNYNIQIRNTNVSNYCGISINYGSGTLNVTELPQTQVLPVDFDSYSRNSIVNMTPNIYVFIDDWNLEEIYKLNYTQYFYLYNGTFTLGNMTYDSYVYAYYSNVYMIGKYFDSTFTFETSVVNVTNSILSTRIYAFDSSTIYTKNITTDSIRIHSNSNLFDMNSQIRSLYYQPYDNNSTLSIINSSLKLFSLYDFTNIYMKNVNITSRFYDYSCKNYDAEMHNVHTAIIRTYAYVYDDFNLSDTGISTGPNTKIINENLTYDELDLARIYIFGGTTRVVNYTESTRYYINSGEIIFTDSEIRHISANNYSKVTFIRTDVNTYSPYYCTLTSSEVNVINSTVKSIKVIDANISIYNSMISYTAFIFNSNANVSDSTFTTYKTGIIAYNSHIRLINVAFTGNLYSAFNPYYEFEYVYYGLFNHDYLDNYFVNVSVNGIYYEGIITNGTNEISLNNNVISGTYVNSTGYTDNFNYHTKLNVIIMYENSSLNVINSTLDTINYDFIAIHDNATARLVNSSINMLRADGLTNVNISNVFFNYLFAEDYANLFSNSQYLNVNKTLFLNDYAHMEIENAILSSYVYIYDHSIMKLYNSKFNITREIYVKRNAQLIYVNDVYNDTNPSIDMSLDSNVRNVYVENVKINTLNLYAFGNFTGVGLNISEISMRVSYIKSNLTFAIENQITLINSIVDEFSGYPGIITMPMKINSTSIYPNHSDYFYSAFQNTNINTFTDIIYLIYEGGSVPGGNNEIGKMYVFGTYHAYYPIIETESNVIHMEVGSDRIIQWHIEGYAVRDYAILLNDTEITESHLEPNTTISIDMYNASIGMYNYTLIVSSEFGINYSTVIVFVHPHEAPTVAFLGSTTEITIHENETATLSWVANDYTPANYSIYINGTLTTTDTWTANNTVSYVFSGTIGTYEITITFRDAFGLNKSNTVIVHVIATATNGETPTNTSNDMLIIILGITSAIIIVIIILKKDLILRLISRKSA